MRLEFFSDGFDGGPLLLLYGGAPREVALLRDALLALTHTTGSLPIHSLPFVESVEHCALTAISADHDVGARETETAHDFAWVLRPESWLEVHELLAPFCDSEEETTRFQYLNPVAGTEVIYSTDRAW